VSRLFLFYHVNRHLDRPDKSGIYCIYFIIAYSIQRTQGTVAILVPYLLLCQPKDVHIEIWY